MMIEKETAVRRVFESIQDKYDFLDSVISFGLDQIWRNRIVKNLEVSEGLTVLDCGAGTGKLTKLIADICPDCELISLDITEKMFRPSVLSKTKFIVASAESIPLPDGSVDRVVSAFLTRNLSSVDRYFSEVFRVLKEGGIFVNLDIYNPRMPVFRQLFGLYFFWLVPFIGDRATKSKSYSYLANSVKSFFPPEEIGKRIGDAGLKLVDEKVMMLGSIALHKAKKE